MIFQKSKWNMLPLFNSVSASTWKPNAIKFFQNLFWLSPPVSHGVTPLGRPDGPVSVNVLCWGVSFIALKASVHAPFCVITSKGCLQPSFGQTAPHPHPRPLSPGSFCSLSLPWCLWILWNRKKKLIRSTKFASPVGPGRETCFPLPTHQKAK